MNSQPLNDFSVYLSRPALPEQTQARHSSIYREHFDCQEPSVFTERIEPSEADCARVCDSEKFLQERFFTAEIITTTRECLALILLGCIRDASANPPPSLKGGPSCQK